MHGACLDIGAARGDARGESWSEVGRCRRDDRVRRRSLRIGPDINPYGDRKPLGERHRLDLNANAAAERGPDRIRACHSYDWGDDHSRALPITDAARRAT